MIRSMWFRLVDALAGEAGRAAHLDHDDRRFIPGWPAGLDLAVTTDRLALVSTGIRAQHALPLYWDELQTSAPLSGRHRPFAVIEGGRGAGASVHT